MTWHNVFLTITPPCTHTQKTSVGSLSFQSDQMPNHVILMIVWGLLSSFSLQIIITHHLPIHPVKLSILIAAHSPSHSGRHACKRGCFEAIKQQILTQNFLWIKKAALHEYLKEQCVGSSDALWSNLILRLTSERTTVVCTLIHVWSNNSYTEFVSATNNLFLEKDLRALYRYKELILTKAQRG